MSVPQSSSSSSHRCMLTGIQVTPYYPLMLYRTAVIVRWSYIRKPSAAPLRWDACQGPHLLVAGWCWFRRCLPTHAEVLFHTRIISVKDWTEMSKHVKCISKKSTFTRHSHVLTFCFFKTAARFHKCSQKDMSETAGTWSRIWSMGRTPEQIISALVETKEGMTRPGQSQRHRPGSTYRVWKEKAIKLSYKFLFIEKATWIPMKSSKSHHVPESALCVQGWLKQRPSYSLE